MFNRKYDYKRAFCEDPEIIRCWFWPVTSMKAKYGVLKEDIYNFDETRFIMGIMSTGTFATASQRGAKSKSVQ